MLSTVGKLLDPYRWLILAALASALAGAYYAHRSSLIEQGREQGRIQGREQGRDQGHAQGLLECRAEVLAVENSTLRERANEITRLTGIIRKANDEYTALGVRLRQFMDRTARLERMRAEDRANFDAAVEQATADSLRDYAQAARDNLERSRSLVERFGREAVESSAAAHALKASSDALAEIAD